MTAYCYLAHRITNRCTDVSDRTIGSAERHGRGDEDAVIRVTTLHCHCGCVADRAGFVESTVSQQNTGVLHSQIRWHGILRVPMFNWQCAQNSPCDVHRIQGRGLVSTSMLEVQQSADPVEKIIDGFGGALKSGDVKKTVRDRLLVPT